MLSDRIIKTGTLSRKQKLIFTRRQGKKGRKEKASTSPCIRLRSRPTNTNLPKTLALLKSPPRRQRLLLHQVDAFLRICAPAEVISTVPFSVL